MLVAFSCHELLCGEWYKLTNMPTYRCSYHVWICHITCHVYMGVIISSDPFWLMVSKGLLLYAFSSIIPCLKFMIRSCSMMFACPKHCFLMLFLTCSVFSKSVKLISFAFLPCYFELVLESSSRTSMFMICRASPVLYGHVLCCYVGVL